VAGLQFAQEFDDLRLHRHVKYRGLARRAPGSAASARVPGNGDALALAAGEFVRVALGRLGVEPDLLECGRDQPPAFGRTRCGAVHLEAFFDDLSHRKPRRRCQTGRSRIAGDALDKPSREAAYFNTMI
jgi:hypothetical protein